MLHSALEDVRKIHTVSEVTGDLRRLIEDTFPSIWVSGEISNFKMAASGHAYFTLKDENAALNMVMFRPSHRLLKFSIEDGMQVIVHGRFSVYEPRGQYQMIVDSVEPQGLGALQLAFEQLKNRLEKEGLFDQARKKELPFLPKTIGIITSPQGAVLHDLKTVLTRRFPNICILVYPVRVQGDGAGVEIAEAIFEMNERRDVDLLIVGRGGGSMEDLWAFNEEIVVRAVFDSRIPVISAVGHETDHTLCDLVADLRAPTPSAAAELAVPEKEDLILAIADWRNKLRYALNQNLKANQERVGYLKSRFRDPGRMLESSQQRVDDLSGRLLQAERHLFLNARHRYREAALRLPKPDAVLKRLRSEVEFQTGGLKRGLEIKLTRLRHALRECALKMPDPKFRLKEAQFAFKGLAARLEAASPVGPLQKGYGLVLKDGVPVQTISAIKTGDVLTLKMRDGEMKVYVLPG